MISAKTKICGIFGHPIEHSLSPLMHNAAFEKLKLDFAYLAFKVSPEDLAAGVKAIRALNFAGVNITIPHKEKIILFLDDLTPEAKAIGAVNTVVNTGSRLIGDNTDGQGFMRSLTQENKINPLKKNVLLLGAGGAGRSVAVSLIKSGIKSLYLYDVMKEKLQNLSSDLKRLTTTVLIEKITAADFEQVLADSHILVNASPVGMKDSDPIVVPAQFLHKKLFIYDVVYNRSTKLIQEAKHQKIKCANGLGMLINQGAIAFELWTGKKAPIQVMKKAIKGEGIC